jgi:hypothetical protein
MRGNVITFTRDPEGSMLTESFPNSSVNRWPMNFTYDVRGELIDSYAGTSPATGNDERLLWAGDCGTRTAIPPNFETSTTDPGLTAIDARTCATVASGVISQVQYNGAFYPSGTTNNVTYDVAGRMVHNSTYSAAFAAPDGIDLMPQSQNADGTAATATTPDWNPGGEIGGTSAWGSGRSFSPTPRELITTKTVDTLYDAENHTVSRGGSRTFSSTAASQNGTSTPAPSPAPTTAVLATTLGWGPNGHPAIVNAGTSGALTLHWDGDVILFVTDANGNVVDFKAGFDGEVTPGDANWIGLTVFDRDGSGLVIDTATPTQNLFSPLNGDGNPTETVGIMMPLYAPYYRTDGFYVGDIQINGGRAFDPAVGTWTTPDAYEGDIHDPMSQQRYMFNRNNAIDYSDPSGYDACVHGICIGSAVSKGLSAAGRVASGITKVAVGRVGSLAAKAIPGVGFVSLFLSLGGATDKETEAKWLAQRNENSNPYEGPVDRPVKAVDSHGNAIPVEEGEQIEGSPDGQYQQVKDSNGRPTGTRIDRGGHSSHKDPKAQGPHGHRPGVTDSTGNPHLPVY